MTTPHKLAAEFATVLRNNVTPKEWGLIVENTNGTSPSCVSHDFIDANECMVEAIENLGVEYDPADTDLYNAAWSLARAKYFV